MAQNSKIEWTQATWNPVTGCTKISTGCLNCYAERLASRLQAMRSPNYKNGFKVSIHPNTLDIPLKWKKPRLIFVNSMSDLFHKDVPFNFIKKIFKIMGQASQHKFQILTKRSARMLKLSEELEWPENVLTGVTVETKDYLNRLNHLRKTPASTKFVSFEPLLGEITEPNLDNIDWVIVGGESGPGARPMSPEWVKEIRNWCVKENTPFFFKQWGGVNKKKNGRLLEKQTWDQVPSEIEFAKPAYV